MMMMDPNVLHEDSDDEYDRSRRSHSHSFEQELPRQSQTMTYSSNGTNGRATNSRQSVLSGSSNSTSAPLDEQVRSIALFGGNSNTGQEFKSLAVNAGYRVRQYVMGSNNQLESQQEDHAAVATSFLQTVVGNSLHDSRAIKKTLRCVDFVVCLLNDSVITKTTKHYPSNNFLTAFVRLLYPLMKEEPSIKLFLFQSFSLASDTHGNTPVLSRVFKTIAHLSSDRTLQLSDNDNVLRHISIEHGHNEKPKHFNKENVRKSDQTIRSKKCSSTTPLPSFHYMVTRPTILIKPGKYPSKRLCASKSQPGPFPISSADLADFTLNALLNTKLYNSCPYVVSDNGL